MFILGLKIMKKWSKSVCLAQLTMSDAEHLQDCYIYKLSHAEGLGWFKNIAFVSSYQDTYAPFDSARIQISKKALKDPKKGGYYLKMASNILSKLTTKILYRIDVNFNIPKK